MQRHSFCRALQLWQVLFLSFSIVFPYFLWVSLDVEGAGGKEGRELAGLPSPTGKPCWPVQLTCLASQADRLARTPPRGSDLGIPT